MAIIRTDLSISKSVAGSTEDVETFIPAVGEFFVTEFDGEAAFDPNTFCKLIWDYGGAGETILWSTAGSAHKEMNLSLTGDGVKKLAVSVDNGLSASVFMSVSAKVVQEV